MGGTGKLPIDPLSVHNLRYDIDRLEKKLNKHISGTLNDVHHGDKVEE